MVAQAFIDAVAPKNRVLMPQDVSIALAKHLRGAADQLPAELRFDVCAYGSNWGPLIREDFRLIVTTKWWTMRKKPGAWKSPRREDRQRHQACHEQGDCMKQFQSTFVGKSAANRVSFGIGEPVVSFGTPKIIARMFTGKAGATAMWICVTAPLSARDPVSFALVQHRHAACRRLPAQRDPCLCRSGGTNARFVPRCASSQSLRICGCSESPV